MTSKMKTTKKVSAVGAKSESRNVRRKRSLTSSSRTSLNDVTTPTRTTRYVTRTFPSGCSFAIRPSRPSRKDLTNSTENQSGFSNTISANQPCPVKKGSPGKCVKTGTGSLELRKRSVTHSTSSDRATNLLSLRFTEKSTSNPN